MGEFLRDRLPDPIAYFEAEGHPLVGPKSAKWKTTDCFNCGGSDPMRVKVASGGWVCMNCGVHGGDVLSHFMTKHEIDFISAARLLGVWQDDGEPNKPYRPKPLSASEALQALALESYMVYVVASDTAKGKPVTLADLARLRRAVRRINGIGELFP